MALGVPGNTTVVVELVNDGWGVFAKNGTQLFLDSNIDLFGDPNSSGDIECNYDQQSKTYFFTEIGALTGEFYGTNLAVLNSKGYSAYFVDTAEGGFCFPDFPHQGIDNNALYITINEFCGPDEDFAGASIYALSKQQLVNHSAPNGAVNAVVWSLGNNYYSFRAATGDPTNTEYLLASEQNDVTQNALDFAWVTGDNKIGKAPVILSLTSIPSESFTEPVDAQSTGDGTTCVRRPSTRPSDDRLVLHPGEDARPDRHAARAGAVLQGPALHVAGHVADGRQRPDGRRRCGVVPGRPEGAQGRPPGLRRRGGHVPAHAERRPVRRARCMMGFSATSPTLNPSSGYMISKNGGKTWSSVTITGAGSGPHVSFSDNQPGYLRKRWGDYSRIAVDPATGDVWMADEYIPSGRRGRGHGGQLGHSRLADRSSDQH